MVEFLTKFNIFSYNLAYVQGTKLMML